jgi:hypothetical protein
MKSESVIYWKNWLKLEKKINDETVLFSWLRHSMATEEIQALTEAVETYFPDLIIKINKNCSGSVERRETK